MGNMFSQTDFLQYFRPILLLIFFHFEVHEWEEKVKYKRSNLPTKVFLCETILSNYIYL